MLANGQFSSLGAADEEIDELAERIALAEAAEARRMDVETDPALITLAPHVIARAARSRRCCEVS